MSFGFAGVLAVLFVLVTISPSHSAYTIQATINDIASAPFPVNSVSGGEQRNVAIPIGDLVSSHSTDLKNEILCSLTCV